MSPAPARPTAPPAEPPREFDRLAVITIQGGGIYGLNLLGQLSYLTETLKVVPVAVAGNSAGSIVAALFWAGYTPWRIRDEFAGLARDKKLAGLVGPFEPEDVPFDLAHFRQLKTDGLGLAAQFRGLRSDPVSRWGRIGRNVIWGQRLYALYQSARGLWDRVDPHVKNRGCFCGDEFERQIDQLIRTGPLLLGKPGIAANRLVEFGDVRRLIREDPKFNPPALFITATNVTGRKLVVFNSLDARFDPVPIARAVRASGGFPAFFRPTDFKEENPPSKADDYTGWYADGGIVSNYPAWIFSKEFRVRLLDAPEYRPLASRPWAHFGLRLERGPVGGDPSNPSEWVYGESLARLLLVGEARTQLENRVANLVTRAFIAWQPPDRTGLPPGIDLLDVDKITPDIVKDMYDAGRAAADRLGRLDYTLPDRADIEPLLGKLIDRALLVLGQVTGDKPPKPDNGRVRFRSNIFIPSQLALHIRYATRMGGDPDEHIRLPLDAGLTGYCLALRRPLLCNLEQLGGLPDEVLNKMFGMTADQHRLVREAGRTWLASVPIFDPFASYPRDLATSGKGPSDEAPHPAPFSHPLAGPMDGAVLGILNLDAALPYSELGLDPDPTKHWAEARIEAILHLMTVTAAEVGQLLSPHFARQTRTPEPNRERAEHRS